MLDTPPPDRPWRLTCLLPPQFSLMAFASASKPPRAANQLSGRPLYELTPILAWPRRAASRGVHLAGVDTGGEVLA